MLKKLAPAAREPINYHSISNLAFLVLREGTCERVAESCSGISVIISFLRRLSGLNVQPKGPSGPGECSQLSSVGCLGQSGLVWFSSPFDSDPRQNEWLAFMLGFTCSWSISELKWDTFEILQCVFPGAVFSSGKRRPWTESVPVFKEVVPTATAGTRCGSGAETFHRTLCPRVFPAAPEWRDCFCFQKSSVHLFQWTLFRSSPGSVD